MKRQDAVRDGQRVTWIGMLVNTLLIVFKLIGGWLGSSQALIADAVHSLSDFFTDLVVLVGLKLGRQEPDEQHPFGHARLETLASAIVGFALILVAVYLAYSSGRDIMHGSFRQPNWLAALAAGVSIAAKEGLYQYTVLVARRIKSQAVLANAWHHRSDALSSIAVLAGVTGALIKPEWRMLDAYAALLVSAFILKVGADIVWQTVKEFTDAAPEPAVVGKMEQCARGVPGVMGVHDLKVRLSGGLYQAEIHVVVDGSLTVSEGHRIAKEVESCLVAEVEGADRVIVHVDPDN